MPDWEIRPASSAPPSVLVVTVGHGEAGTAAPAVDETGCGLALTHALSLASALGALDAATFDCVLVELDTCDATSIEVLDALRHRARGAAVVVVLETPSSAPDLDRLADHVVTRRRLAATGRAAEVQYAVDRARLQSQLRAAEESVARLTGIVESVGDAVFTITVDRTVTSWNRGAEELYGYQAFEMVGRDAALLCPPGSDEPHRLLEMVARGESVRGLETVRRTRDGSLAEVSMTVTPLHDADGVVTGAVVVARDITDRRELEAELVRQTMHDALTGLPNRAYLSYRLSQSLVAARNRNSPVAVLFVDLDQFKAVNDIHGHLAGDRLLATIAERLRGLARPTDTVARLGGDEFVLVCPDTDVAAANRTAQRVIEVIGAPVRVDRRDLRIGASIGIAVSPPLDADAETMIKHADTAMYEAKSRGRSRSQVFDVAFARRALAQGQLASELREALAKHLLEVHYQPVIDLATDRLVSLEALTRWRHPVHGPVSPDTFIRLAEDHGFVAELDRWVLARACREVAGRRATGELAPDVTVAVNLSARTLDDPGLVDMVHDATREAGLPPHALVLEITETAVLRDRESAKASLAGLRELGAGVSLDDFGTGYSSLSFLRELPVTSVKIDRSFIRHITEQPEDLAITEAIVKLAHGLGLETIAEGIETARQLALLRRLGCTAAQGHWWSPAVPMSDVVAALPAPAPSRGAVAVAPPMVDVRRRGRPRRRLPQTAPAPLPSVCCLRAGLDRGQSWLVVASTDRLAAFARDLGHLHTPALAGGALVELEAYETLRRISATDGRLDPARYDSVVGSALRRLAARSGEVGVYVELGPVNQPLPGRQVSEDLRRRLAEATRIDLEYGDHPADCGRHAQPAVVHLAAGDSNAS